MDRLGLPDGISSCLFDLDGVLTHTAALHFEAWQQMFNSFLARHRATAGGYQPFLKEDYLRFVDGKPRADGVRSFLESRGIRIPEGSASDLPGEQTVHSLGSIKNEAVNALMKERGVEVFPGSLRYVEAVVAAGMRRAVVSASANARAVLEASGLIKYFDTVIDGSVAMQRGLRGKPFPDTFLHAGMVLDTEPASAAVFEDALAGVTAARDGGFGFVVGVDRAGQAADLLAEGADIVVQDLAELLEQV